MLFSRRDVVETRAKSLVVVEVEVGGQSGWRLSNCVKLVKPSEPS